MSAKDILLRPIDSEMANALVKRVHYSRRICSNSQFHIGVFWNGKLEGALQFGPSLDKRRMMGLVRGTQWHEFLELNRMAFTDRLPRNSESRALAVSMRILRKHAPQIKWIVTFADGTQCGDGTIYRASGFLLTSIKKNAQIWEADGAAGGPKKRIYRATVTKATNPRRAALSGGGAGMARYVAQGFKPMRGFQLRYVLFLDPTWRDRLTVPVLPYSAIAAAGAGMYRGQRRGRTIDGDLPSPLGKGGSSPTRPLQPFDPADDDDTST